MPIEDALSCESVQALTGVVATAALGGEWDKYAAEAPRLAFLLRNLLRLCEVEETAADARALLTQLAEDPQTLRGWLFLLAADPSSSVEAASLLFQPRAASSPALLSPVVVTGAVAAEGLGLQKATALLLTNAATCLGVGDAIAATLRRAHGLESWRPCAPVLMVLAFGPPSTPLLAKVVRSLLRHNDVLAASLDGDFSHTVVGALLSHGASADTCVVAEAWATLLELVVHRRADMAAFVTRHLDAFVAAVTAHMRPGPRGEVQVGASWYVRCRQAMKLLCEPLGDPAYGRARTRLADCPALLAAVLQVIGCLQHRPSPSRAEALLRHECLHVIKVFIAKPKKCLAARYLLSANRDALTAFVTDAGTDEAFERLDPAELALLRAALLATDPLTMDELHTLHAFVCQPSTA